MASGSRNSADNRDGNYNNLHRGLVRLQPQTLRQRGCRACRGDELAPLFSFAGWGQPPTRCLQHQFSSRCRGTAFRLTGGRFWDILRHAD
jgi:hypothetical protein